MADATKIPNTAQGLAEAMEQALGEALVLRGGQRTVTIGGDWPGLRDMEVNLDDAAVREDHPPQPPKRQGKAVAGPTIGRVTLHGRPIHARGSQVQLSLEAQDVRLSFDQDQRGRLLVLPEEARAGHVEVSIPRAQLETLLLSAANAGLGKAVNITAVSVNLKQTGQRSVDLEAQITAKKLISTVIRLSGRAEIDQQLNARLSDLRCAGEGMVGKAVSALLGKYLEQVNGREYALAGMALGQIRLRDVRVDVAEGLRVRAEFGR